MGLMTAVAVAGCSGGGSDSLTSPAPPPPAPTSAFSLRLSVNDLDRLDDQNCNIRVIAEASGGQIGAFAEWGELEGRSFDVQTGEFIGVSRVRQLSPEIFASDRIQTGEDQQGTVDLELFRREEGEPVLVELDFHYVVRGDGVSGSEDERVVNLSHKCQ